MIGQLAVALLQVAAPPACGQCHRAQAHSYAQNSMSKALYRIAEAPALRENPKLTYSLGRFRYTLEQTKYSVTDGTSTLTLPLEYAFGQGAAGQTYVFRHEGRWYESRLSYYRSIKGLDLTMGAPAGEPRTLIEAAGREMTAKDVVECFRCHTTNSVVAQQVAFDRLQPGVGCENCHAGGTAHASAIVSGNVKAAALPQLSKLSTEEQADLCGRCHRTWADIAANGPRGIGNVRFQPYRIANSKCYDATDRRIACTACHDPHGPLETSAVSYDTRCTACHNKSAGVRASVCPTASSGCVSCHMPRYEIPGSHHLFTDHQIRIVRKNETYPN